MGDVVDKSVVAATADVTVPTTTETVVVTSDPVSLPFGEGLVSIKGWAQLTTGTGAVAVGARIRRGTAVTGALVGDENNITLGAAAGSTEVMSIQTAERRSGIDSVQYVMTLQQVSATGNGTSIQAYIEVEVLN